MRRSLRATNPVWKQSFLRRWWLKFAWWFPPTRRWYKKKIEASLREFSLTHTEWHIDRTMPEGWDDGDRE